MCDIVTYNRKYIVGLQRISGTEFLKPLEFPVKRVREMSFVMLMRLLENNLRMGDSGQWSKPHLRKVRAFSPTL